MVWWLWSSMVFAINLDGLLSERYKASKGMATIFGWKVKVTNIYNNAMNVIQNNEVNAIYYGVDILMKSYPEFAWCNVTRSDVINILYNWNSSFRVALDQIVVSKSKKKVDIPSGTAIKRSYKAIIQCRDWTRTVDEPSQYTDINNMFNAMYSVFAENKFREIAMSESNVGADIFQNGSLDDSDYDLVVDADKIGKRMFSSFTTPIQTLFYQLPSYNQWWWIDIWWWLGTDYLPPVNSDVSVVPWTTTIVVNTWKDTITYVSNNNNTQKDPARADPWVSSFIQGANTSLVAPNNLYDIWWDVCSSWVAADLSPILNNTISTELYQSMLDISPIDINEYILKIPSTKWKTTTGNITTAAPIWNANTMWKEFADTPIGGDCGYECSLLTGLTEQTDCNLKCAETCTSKCNGLPTYDALACKSQCLCKVVSGPVWIKWKWMEDMYRIKFCTVPVQDGGVSGWKKVYSIYDIFFEIKGVLNALLNGWENIKKTKPKEQFDTALADIKFADLFSFQIAFTKKSLFANKSASTIKKEKQQENDRKASYLLGKKPAPNKYVIVSDVIANGVWNEINTNSTDQKQKIADLKSLEAKSEPSTSNVMALVNIQKIQLLNDTVFEFVKSNYTFWYESYKAFKELSDLSKQLKEDIDSKW